MYSCLKQLYLMLEVNIVLLHKVQLHVSGLTMTIFSLFFLRFADRAFQYIYLSN